MRNYRGIDVGRVFFACLIPMLHIGLSGTVVDFIRQYLSRLGVPFFFAVSGMFLAESINKRGHREAFRRYVWNTGRLLLVWLIIYMPLFVFQSGGIPLREFLFRTPAYLWFLTSLLIAAIPFCLVRNRKALQYAAVPLYIWGTIFGGAYQWLIGGCPLYESIFLTTRNGIFFALPLMCIGEATRKQETASMPLLFLFGGILWAEISFVGAHVSPSDDRSMYLFLPLFTYYLVLAFRSWNPNIDTRYFRGISSAIYLMQYGIIAVVMKIAWILHIQGMWINWVTLLCVWTFPAIFYLSFKNTKLVKLLF